MRRRRPLLRAAAVGGGAYMAGKSAQRRRSEQEGMYAEQDQRISDLEQQQAAPAAPAPAAEPAAGPSMLDQLNQLAGLHQSGMLTDEEFSAAKAKLLGS
jgi:hypothetical protein